jgi:uncharacterized protein YdhG (YjbR/CyaY superfamily)
MPTQPNELESYLAKLSAEARATLEKVRAAIAAAAPGAGEGFSYGMPAFIQGKPVAGYAASAGHCAYYPMSGAITAALAADLAGYHTSKGAIRFPIGQALPAALIRKLVKARLAEIAAGAPRGGAKTRSGRTGAAGAVTARKGAARKRSATKASRTGSRKK